ncbi:hypothetical protein F2Q69_00020607 [Brassica cretica]|uniref:Uncharacterized protein n=1 Tax=Brassica cretica TaxID=69181 RepID=A0A8S9Q683_BRACR|nr:hypothetical protein F2Q69_00020607 [Brassica cretica]
MCSNWLLMKIEEDEGGRPRRIYSIGKRQSHRKSSLRKPMIKVPPLASFICVPSTVPSSLIKMDLVFLHILVVILLDLLQVLPSRRINPLLQDIMADEMPAFPR